MSYLGLILGALGVILISKLWNLLLFLTWKPYAMRKRFKKQGVTGPEYKFWSGCIDEIRRLKKEAYETEMDIYSHDIVPRVLSNYYKWMSQYGGTFLYWFGAKARLCITDVELVKQVLSNKFGFYPKTKPPSGILSLLGKGLVLTEGAEWARHRRVITPAFTMDKLKVMAKQMAACTLSMLDKWHGQMIQAEVNNIEVNKQFQELTAGVISHAAFGSCFIEGKQVFLAQKELQMLFLSVALSVQIHAFRYLPTKRNIKIWRLEKKIKDTLVGIIQNRLNSNDLGYGNDLLGIMTRE